MSLTRAFPREVRIFGTEGAGFGAPVFRAALDDLRSLAWQEGRAQMAREIELVAAYAMADARAMFDPHLHNIQLRHHQESESDYEGRAKFMENLVSRVLDSRLAGCAMLPLELRTPIAEEFDFEPLMRNLDMEKLQTLTEISGTVAVRPLWDPFEREVVYEHFPAPLFYPYLGYSGELLGITTLKVTPNGIRAQIWTESAYLTIDESGAAVNGELGVFTPNPYGEVPFSIFRVRPHPWKWWGVTELGWVSSNNLAVDKAWSDLLHLAKMQAFAWYVEIAGKPLDDPLDPGGDLNHEPDEDPDKADGTTPKLPARKIGGGDTRRVEHGGDVKAISPEAQIQPIAATIEAMSDMTLDGAYVFRTRGQKVIPDSGFAHLVQQSPYLRKMRLVRGRFGGNTTGPGLRLIGNDKEGLTRLMQFAELVRFAGENPFLPNVRRNPGFRVFAEWDETPLLAKPQRERDDADTFRLDSGQASVIDLIMEHEGVSRAMAIEIAERVKQEQEQYGGNVSPAPAPGDEAAAARAASQVANQ